MVRSDFLDAEEGCRRFCLVLEDEDADLCLKHPGHDVDLVVATTVRTLTEVWTGERSFTYAPRKGDLRTEGRRGLGRQLPSWFLRSVFTELRECA